MTPELLAKATEISDKIRSVEMALSILRSDSAKLKSVGPLGLVQTDTGILVEIDADARAVMRDGLAGLLTDLRGRFDAL